MRLFYAPGACSLSVHIILEELGFTYSLEEVDWKNKAPLLKHNPKGYVPTLVFQDGRVMTEAVPILVYLAELRPHSHLLAPAGTELHFRTLEWLNFLATEIYKGYTPLFKFKKHLGPEALSSIFDLLDQRLQYVEGQLAHQSYLSGLHHTLADIYAFVVFRMGEGLGINFNKFPRIQDLRRRIGEIPAVKEVIEEEETPKRWRRSA